MADEQATQTKQETIETVATPTVSENLQTAAFDDKPIKQSQEQAAIPVEKKKDEVDTTASTSEIPLEWLKKEFDIDDPAVLKAEREEYKKLKETPPIPAELKFADDESKHIYEVVAAGKEKRKELRQLLETQERLEDLVSADVNEKTADDILKLNLKLKYKDLNDREIEHKFNKEYALPKEPVQGTLEEETDFEARVSAWKETVEDIKMSKIIDAKTAKPELEKYKSELVLPNIQQKENQTQNQPTQEDLAALKEAKETFLLSAELSINSFNGVSLQVKDKDVDYTVSYTPSQEEKTTLSNKVKEFAESGFNANAVLADRWVSEDGKTINVDQMVKDLSKIYGDEKATQKLVTDSANKRLEAFLKEKKQINVNEQNQNGTFTPSNATTQLDNVREQAFA